MPRSYLRLMPDFFERKAAGTDRRPAYPPAALAALVGVFCLAEQQPERGRFKSKRVLQVLLEEFGGKAYAKQVPVLIKNEDIMELPDGTIYVDGWDELQEGDFKVQERMRRYRQRKAEGESTVTQTVTQGVTENVTPPPENRNGLASAVSGRRLAVGGKHVAVDGPPSPDHGGDEAPDDSDFEDLDPGFRERYGELVAAFGGQVDRRMAMEFQQIAEDHDVEAIRTAIRACMAQNDRPYPSKVRPHLPKQSRPEQQWGTLPHAKVVYE